MKRPWFLWLAFPSLALLIAVTYAKHQAPTAVPLAADSPLEVQTSTVRAAEGHNLNCSVTNRSDKDVVAYSIVADFFDSQNKPAGRLSANAIMNLTTNSKGLTGGLAPGQTGGPNRPFTLPAKSDGTPVSFKVSVDYVLFKDGSTWGPDSMKQSLNIMGTQQGWRQSRAHLKQLLAERGIQAVAEALAD
jgi:hypothetical protein